MIASPTAPTISCPPGRSISLAVVESVPPPFDESPVATLTALTAKTVGEAVARFVKRPLQEVIVSGGGMLNKTLMGHLEWTLWPAVPRPITVYGIHPLAKEPAAFALLAAETLRGRPGNLPSVTGARRPVVLGKVIR